MRIDVIRDRYDVLEYFMKRFSQALKDENYPIMFTTVVLMQLIVMGIRNEMKEYENQI